MWLVTVEASDGSFYEDPECFDTSAEAVSHASSVYEKNKTKYDENDIVVNVYQCVHHQMFGKEQEADVVLVDDGPGT